MYTQFTVTIFIYVPKYIMEMQNKKQDVFFHCVWMNNVFSGTVTITPCSFNLIWKDSLLIQALLLTSFSSLLNLNWNIMSS